MVGVEAVIDRGGMCVDRGCWIAAEKVDNSQGGSAQVTRLYCLLAAAATSPPQTQHHHHQGPRNTNDLL